MFQIGCSQKTHSHSTQRSESIQVGTKRHVKFRRLFDSESLGGLTTVGLIYRFKVQVMDIIVYWGELSKFAVVSVSKKYLGMKNG